MAWVTKIMLLCVILFMAWSRWNCYERLTWWLEAMPVLLALPPVLLTSRKFPLTTLLYSLMTVHAMILLMGAKYTYARTPFGFFLQDLFHLKRNCYDRIGHFFQGFVPAILVREILIRTTPRIARRGKRFFFIVTCVCLAVSAFYELLEWGGAVVLGQKADDFLGLQGDIWDSQWDMFLALIGAIVAQLTLSKWHDRQIDTLKGKQKSAKKQ